VLLSAEYISEVAQKEAYIHKTLQHPIVKEVRSSGLMMAVELTKRKYLKHVVGKAFEEGALIDYFLFNNRSFRLAPPLIYTMRELEAAMTVLLKALDYAEKKYN
jgi:acetylornithine/succinyldiaminopimelate/putrescine aminotransferase